MQNHMNRTLTILADGVPVTGYARAKLIGTERLGLYPSLFMLDLWNLSEDDYLLLSRCKVVLLCTGSQCWFPGACRMCFGTDALAPSCPGLPPVLH